jgi:class 3 adenylate cyclase
VEAAAGLTELVRGAAAESGEELVLNVGLHWGATVYMGQLVTDGRLEVTALGDEVNECARIQESARDGCVLASKALIEHLDDGDAAAVGIDCAAAVYDALADLRRPREGGARRGRPGRHAPPRLRASAAGVSPARRTHSRVR